MSRRAVLVLVAACGAGAPPPTEPTTSIPQAVGEQVPRVEVAVAGDHVVRVLHTSAGGLVVDRAVETPGPISGLAYAGADPIALLASGDLGRIGANGFTPIAAPEWKTARGLARRSVKAVEGGLTFASYCEADADGNCAEIQWARVDVPGPISTEYPDLEHTWGKTNIKGPRGPAGYVADLDEQTEGGYIIGYLTCTGPDGKLRERGFRAPTWISLSPPLFAAVTTDDDAQHFYRGCVETHDYTSAVEGPHVTTWLTGTRLEVYRHGVKIGETEPGMLAFHTP